MGEVLAVRNEYRAQNWVQVIQECRASGLTNRAFCRQRGIPEKKFYYWLRKLRTQALTERPFINVSIFNMVKCDSRRS